MTIQRYRIDPYSDRAVFDDGGSWIHYDDFAQFKSAAEAQVQELAECLAEVIGMNPAMRNINVGSPGSLARELQNRQIEAEDKALRLIAKAGKA